nr:MAG TPA: hypothetical protein [Caudoviricetes sp.]
MQAKARGFWEILQKVYRAILALFKTGGLTFQTRGFEDSNGGV